MRILQLCHKVPYPPSDGGSIAMNQITQALLKKGIEVKVLALAPTGTMEQPEKIPGSYAKATQIELFPIDTRVKPWPAFINLFTRSSYNISRFYCKTLASRLGKLLTEERFDIIQLEGLYLTPYIPFIRQHTGSPILFRSHNIEHFIWERLAHTATNKLKKAYLTFLARRLRAYEMKTVHQVDGLIAISPVDMRFFEKNGFAQPGITIPVAVDPRYFNPANASVDNNTVFHIGSMDWRPNQDGVTWFLDNVWPLVVEKNPGLRFVLAGKNIAEGFYQYAGSNVTVAGRVPDAAAFMHGNELMVVPLLSGGGMRVKIIEAMSAGKAIVSTSIGAEGINCTHGENILLADTAEEMAETILHCFRNRNEMQKIGNSARIFASQNHDMENTMEKLIAFYETFLIS